MLTKGFEFQILKHTMENLIMMMYDVVKKNSKHTSQFTRKTITMYTLYRQFPMIFYILLRYQIDIYSIVASYAIGIA